MAKTSQRIQLSFTSHAQNRTVKAMNSYAILIVDDSPDDRFFLARNLRRTGLPLSIYEVQDGYEAIDYLSHQGNFADRLAYPMPQLLLLDLKMPGKNGFDILHWLKQNPPAPPIKIVVLSGSDLDLDIQAALNLGAERYLIKPAGPEELRNLICSTLSLAA